MVRTLRRESGREISMIRTELKGVNIFLEKYWPAIMSFFKTHMLALDRFWQESEDLFDDFKRL